jgi:hypothetical protein
MQVTHAFGGSLSLAAGLVALLAGLGHLVIDELWAIELKGGLVPRLKSTFGSAFKFWSGSLLATCFCYAGLAAMLWVYFARP